MKNSPSVEILNWDSNFFNLKIGKLEADSPEECIPKIEELKEKEVDLSYIFIKGEHNQSNPLIQNGVIGKLMDIRYTYETSLFQEEDFTSDQRIYEINKPSVRLYDLAFQSGHESRYKKDSNFANGEFERFYQTWIDNSFNGKMANYVLGFYNEPGFLNGFITLKIKDKLGEIGLFAVDESSRGQGIGKLLIGASKKFTRQENKNILRVVTQKENKMACRFYERTGFKLISVESVYHKWFK